MDGRSEVMEASCSSLDAPRGGWPPVSMGVVPGPQSRVDRMTVVDVRVTAIQVAGSVGVVPDVPGGVVAAAVAVPSRVRVSEIA